MLTELALTLTVLTIGGFVCFGIVLLLGWLCGKLVAGLARLFKIRPQRHIPLDCWLDEMLDLERTAIVDMDRTRVTKVPGVDPTRVMSTARVQKKRTTEKRRLRRRSRHVAKHRLHRGKDE